MRHPRGRREEQLDLFSAGGLSQALRPRAAAARDGKPPGDLDDAELIAAIPAAGIVDGPALAMEAGRRGLSAAVPALARLCRRFSGFGGDCAVPEQVAALEALAMIGGREAAHAVARLITKSAVQGPALKIAVAAAAQLRSDLPPEVVLAVLRHADPEVRVSACRCVRMWPRVVPLLLDLLDDSHGEVRVAAACALGRLGRREALPALTGYLERAPSPDVIEAVTAIADEDCVVLLARLARTMPDLADTALEALEMIDHPRAAQLRPAPTEPRTG
jgi:hypothetical protein